MASNYTTNYELPIWAAGDSFLRTEFNDANQKIDAAVKEISEKFYVGIYECDGTYGADHPITLTFPFQPRALYLASMDRSVYGNGWFSYGTEEVYIYYSDNLGGDLKFSWIGNTVSFYSTKNASIQFNYSGKTLYIALK